MGRGDVAAGHLTQFIGAAFADADTRSDECGPTAVRRAFQPSAWRVAS